MDRVPVFRGPAVTLAAYGGCGATDRKRTCQVEAEYSRQVLKSTVQFEKRIRTYWREKCLAKNRRIAELEERIVKLERSLGEKEEL